MYSFGGLSTGHKSLELLISRGACASSPLCINSVHLFLFRSDSDLRRNDPITDALSYGFMDRSRHLKLTSLMQGCWIQFVAFDVFVDENSL